MAIYNSLLWVMLIYAQNYVQFDYIYVNDGGLGVASYHLYPDNSGSYLNYANCPKEWKTDDGKKFPPKMLFYHQNFDLTKKSFTGAIMWNVTFGGDVQWNHTMKFSNDWTTLESGEILMISADGNTENV